MYIDTLDCAVIQFYNYAYDFESCEHVYKNKAVMDCK